MIAAINRGIVKLLIPLLLFSLLSCRTQNLFEAGPAKTTVDDSLFREGADSYEYRIRTDDKVNIGIWNNDDISVGSVYGIYNSGEGYGKWLLVDANGEIAVPRIGNLKVAGLTVPEMRKLLVDSLSRTVKSPVVDIKILNKDVTVLGEVKAPGKIHLEKEKNTVVDILGLAGDFDLYGNKAKVQVLRTVNDTVRTITLDLTHADGLAANNILIHPGDIIYVPSKKRKQWDKTASSTIVPAASAITAILLILKTFFPTFP
jgi:polysaccharide export outer membrane protein